MKRIIKNLRRMCNWFENFIITAHPISIFSLSTALAHHNFKLKLGVVVKENFGMSCNKIIHNNLFLLLIDYHQIVQ